MEGKFTFESKNTAVFAKDDKESDLMKFSVAGYTGAVMESGYGKVAIDLEGMKFRNEVTPMFQHHDSTRIVGHADKKEITESGLILSGVISGTSEAAQEVIETSKNGFPWQASVGVDIMNYRILEKDEEYDVNGMTMTGPGVILSETELFETSFVPLGRDRNTSSALFSEDFEVKLQTNNEEQIMEKEVKTEEVVEQVSNVAEMRAAFPDNAEFALDAIERGLSVLEAKAEFADVLLAQRDELALELSELQASVENNIDTEGEMPVEYFEEEEKEVFEKDSPEAEVVRLQNEAKAEFGFNDQEALNHVLSNNRELADKLI